MHYVYFMCVFAAVSTICTVSVHCVVVFPFIDDLCQTKFH